MSGVTEDIPLMDGESDGDYVLLTSNEPQVLRDSDQSSETTPLIENHSSGSTTPNEDRKSGTTLSNKNINLGNSVSNDNVASSFKNSKIESSASEPEAESKEEIQSWVDKAVLQPTPTILVTNPDNETQAFTEDKPSGQSQDDDVFDSKMSSTEQNMAVLPPSYFKTAPPTLTYQAARANTGIYTPSRTAFNGLPVSVTKQTDLNAQKEYFPSRLLPASQHHELLSKTVKPRFTFDVKFGNDSLNPLYPVNSPQEIDLEAGVSTRKNLSENAFPLKDEVMPPRNSGSENERNGNLKTGQEDDLLCSPEQQNKSLDSEKSTNVFSNTSSANSGANYRKEPRVDDPVLYNASGPDASLISQDRPLNRGDNMSANTQTTEDTSNVTGRVSAESGSSHASGTPMTGHGTGSQASRGVETGSCAKLAAPGANDDVFLPEKSGGENLATFFLGNDAGMIPRTLNGFTEGGTSKNENPYSVANGNGVKDKESEVRLRRKRPNQMSIMMNSLFMILTGLYGILIVVLGSVIPLTEIFVPEGEAFFEVFYLYLYGVSIIFLVYVYVYLLRRNRLRTDFVARTLSRSMSWTRSWANSWMPARNGSNSRLRKRMVSLDESNHHTGTFYLRLGVLGFGIGSMIHSGLNFGKFLGSITDGQCDSGVALMLKPLLHLAFTFSQLYFIFMNSKMCIHRYKVLARFGLMHMAATNICVWFRSIVVETLHEIHHHHAHHHDDAQHRDHAKHAAHVQDAHNETGHEAAAYGLANRTATLGRKLLAAASQDNGSHGNQGGLVEFRCSWNNMMGKAVDSAGPYLYPCTIEYSLMCAGILYVMWNNVGSKPRRRTDSEVEEEQNDLKHQRMSVDCTSSSRGLFLGILLTVCCIISIIAFYVMGGQPHLRYRALLLTHLSETFIYCITLFALVLAVVKMRYLRFHADHKSDLEEALILIAHTGLLAFNVFSLMAAILMSGEEGAVLTIVSNLTMIFQAAAQTIFMLAGDRLSAANASQERRKPGRQYVTFLLLCNFGMWIINTFETQKPEHNPLQVAFYGPEAWSIFSHISVPLGIYYRFHSTVCLSNIWKNAWKVRKHIHH